MIHQHIRLKPEQRFQKVSELRPGQIALLVDCGDGDVLEGEIVMALARGPQDNAPRLLVFNGEGGAPTIHHLPDEHATCICFEGEADFRLDVIRRFTTQRLIDRWKPGRILCFSGGTFICAFDQPERLYRRQEAVVCISDASVELWNTSRRWERPLGYESWHLSVRSISDEGVEHLPLFSFEPSNA
jgi:hypothetical protein